MKPNTFYHIYNHANGDENLFRSEENYHYFLQQWAKYIEPVAGTYSYCLMPNHFHFLVKTQTLEVLQNLQGLQKERAVENQITQAFSNLFNSYSKAFNKLYDRRGSLFIPNFKRKEISNTKYLTTIVTYIHRNPVHHGIRNKVGDWPFCSYDAMLSSQSTLHRRKEVQTWYEDAKAYKSSHQMEVRLPDNSLFIDY